MAGDWIGRQQNIVQNLDQTSKNWAWNFFKKALSPQVPDVPSFRSSFSNATDQKNDKICMAYWGKHLQFLGTIRAAGGPGWPSRTRVKEDTPLAYPPPFAAPCNLDWKAQCIPVHLTHGLCNWGTKDGATFPGSRYKAGANCYTFWLKNVTGHSRVIRHSWWHSGKTLGSGTTVMVIWTLFWWTLFI